MAQLRELLGGRIRDLRKASGMTQEDLADKAGLHSTYVGGIERGERNVSIDNIAKIAKGLGVEVIELFRFRARRSPAALKKELKLVVERHDPEMILRILEAIEGASQSAHRR